MRPRRITTRRVLFALGPLPNNETTLVYGRTCRFGIYSGGQVAIVAGDIRLNATVNWTTTPHADGCNNEIDVRSVVTHEAGHWWGLGHVDPVLHPGLTMRGGVGGSFPCTTWMRTLGLGDMQGMRFLY